MIGVVGKGNFSSCFLSVFFAAVVHNEAGEMGKANPSRREKANYINLA
jgi:hypothetical protein